MHFYAWYCEAVFACINLKSSPVFWVFVNVGFLFFRSSGNTTLSASGILLPASFSVAPSVLQIDGSYKDTQSLVVTVASIVGPFLSLEQRESMSQVGILENSLFIFLLLCAVTIMNR